MTTYKLFIDDERNPIDPSEWVIVRSSTEAILYVSKHGMPYFCQFDHDLGGNDTAIMFINWLIEQLLDGDIRLPQNFGFDIHSQNPIGAANIKSKMNQILLHFR